jgi:HEAT repeat protein
MIRPVLLCILLVVGCQKNSASYEGRPASYWKEQMKNPDYMARMRAANAMSHLGEEGKESIQDLIYLLKDNVALVRWAAATSLGTFGADAADALPTLEKMANEDEDPPARSAADEAVRRIRHALNKKK